MRSLRSHDRQMLAAGLAALGAMLLSDPANAADKVRLGLAWTPQAEFGGFYQAQAEGLYNAAGLDVTIRPGGPQINTPQLIIGGALDFAVLANAFEQLNMVQEGIPYVTVAAFSQRDPQIIISHQEMGFNTLADLKGHPILLASFARQSFWPFLRSKFSFTDDQIRPYTFSLQPFIQDKTLSQQGYLTVEPFALARQGIKITTFLLSDYGYNPYANVLIVSKKMAAEKPDVVQRFVDASIKGWNDFLKGPRENALKLIIEGDPNYTRQDAENTVATMKEHGIVDSGDALQLGIGAMTDARWKAIFDTMVDAGIYKPSLEYSSGYTTQFVNKKVGLP